MWRHQARYAGRSNNARQKESKEALALWPTQNKAPREGEPRKAKEREGAHVERGKRAPNTKHAVLPLPTTTEKERAAELLFLTAPVISCAGAQRRSLRKDGNECASVRWGGNKKGGKR